jgi:hypothetical protein
VLEEACPNSSVVLSCLLTGGVTIAFLLSSPAFRDWFIFPIYLCGAVIGIDAINWARGRLRLFDPVGIVGAFGVYFFFLAPLLHVRWDSYLLYVTPPVDWRPWLGRMAWLNLAGILAYAAGRRLANRWGSPPGARSLWQFERETFRPLLVLALVITFCCQIVVYASFGGISGYIAAFSNTLDGAAAFQGMGWFFMISESFPLFLMIGFAAHTRWSGKQRTWLAIGAVILLFIVIKIFFGGLRGSRANYVWPLFWLVGVVHLWVREIPRKFVLAAVACLILFMYSYGYYKSFGADSLTVLRGGGAQSAADGRTMQTTLLGDLGRADVQAFLLYRFTASESGSDYGVGWGRTYLGTAVILVPQRVWPDRPPSKVKEGTEALFGRMAWSATAFRASNAYGLAGETMLNFGPVAVPLAYFLLGVVVGVVRRWSAGLDRRDSRVLLVPFLVSLCLYLIVWDSDVVLYYVITTGLLPFLFIALTSRKTPLEGRVCHP